MLVTNHTRLAYFPVPEPYRGGFLERSLTSGWALGGSSSQGEAPAILSLRAPCLLWEGVQLSCQLERGGGVIGAPSGTGKEAFHGVVGSVCVFFFL